MDQNKAGTYRQPSYRTTHRTTKLTVVAALISGDAGSTATYATRTGKIRYAQSLYVRRGATTLRHDQRGQAPRHLKTRARLRVHKPRKKHLTAQLICADGFATRGTACCPSIVPACKADTKNPRTQVRQEAAPRAGLRILILDSAPRQR